jgi:hypothetical protein
MKNSIGILISAVAFSFYSCSEDASTLEVTSINSDDVSFEATSTSLFDDVDDAVDFASGLTSFSGGRYGEGGGPGGEKFGDCVSVVNDEATDTRTIDFGDGCEGRDGRIRKGKIVIVHDGEKDVVGSSRTVTFVDFSIDTIQIEGVRAMTLSASSDTEKAFLTTLVGGKMTFPDGTIATREASKTRILTFEIATDTMMRPKPIESRKFGVASGINKDALAYSHLVNEDAPLLHLSVCMEEKVVAPVSGIVIMTLEGESDVITDYGDGTCDNLALVTKDGVTTEIEVDAKQGRRKYHGKKGKGKG